MVNAVPVLRRNIHASNDDGESNGHTPDIGALLAAVEESGQRINDIVQGVLSLTRGRDGVLGLRATQICDGIDAVLSVLRNRVKKNIKVHRQYDWNNEVVCYPELVSQVIMNVLCNAIDAIGPEGGNIWIHVERAGETAIIRIRDDGPGVEPADQKKIFSPFFTTKPPGSGTGLGLAISRQVIEMHHGTIEFADDLREGMEFIIRLPIQQPDHEDPDSSGGSDEFAVHDS